MSPETASFRSHTLDSETLGLLNQVSHALGAAPDRNSMLENAVTALGQALGINRCALVLLDWERQQARVAAEYGEASSERPAGFDDHFAYAQRLVASTPVVLQRGSHSLLWVPLVVGNVVVGIIELLTLDEAHRFAPADVAFAEAIAGLVATALANLQLSESLHRQEMHLQTIQELTARIGVMLDLSDVSVAAAELIADRCEYYHVHVFMLDEAGQFLLAQGGNGPVGRELVTSGERLSIDGDGLCVSAVRVGEPILVNDVSQDPRYRPCTSLPATRSELVVPMKTGGRVIGVLDVQSDSAGAFDDKDRLLLETIADQLAVALEKARLYAALQERASLLVAAYEGLQAVDRMQDEFVQTISHELRTPLTFIMGYAELMLDGMMGELNPQQAEAMQTVINGADGVVRMVNNIISLTRSQPVDKARRPVDLVSLATAAVRSARIVTERRGLEPCVDAPPGLPEVWGDPHRLTQVLDNLLSNAVKFSPRGGAICVRLRAQPDCVRVEISDQGIGMPPEQLDRVWDRFYQVDSTTTRRFGGTGLGLAIVKRLVEEQGGEVGVTSVLGEGSTFYFTVPALQPHEGEQMNDGQ